MQIKESEFTYYKYRNITVVSNTESGLFAVQYGDDSKIPEAKFEQDTHDWRFMDKGDTYADALGCEHTAVKSMTAVHAFLDPLWSRGLD